MISENFKFCRLEMKLNMGTTLYYSICRQLKCMDGSVSAFLKCMDKSVLVSQKCMDGSVLAYLRFAMQSGPTRFLQLDNSDVP